MDIFFVAMASESPQKPYLISILSRKDRLIIGFLIVLWVVGQLLFWHWWLQPEHIVSTGRHIINSLLLLWTFLMPAYFFFFIWRMKRPVPQTLANLQKNNWRVAMVTTKTPGEPLAMVQKTLLAMLEQDYPHDVWLGDEDPKPETLAWCKSNGVRVYTRKDLPNYNRESWPRRKRCKEGNLAYFYDYYGYNDYDIVVQLDTDHVPEPGYLAAMLVPFADEKVGYVSAPSICDANANSSWSARGRLHFEAAMHGAVQSGYTHGFSNMCIGSHYAVRTKALKEIGGIGPELAEDHSTTLLMQSGGWTGVHAIDAIAHGDGPITFADCMKQEFQWSRSVVVLLVTLLPQRWRKLSPRLRFHFLFTELWYIFVSLSMLIGAIFSIIALLLKTPWATVNYVDFLLHSIPLSILVILVLLILKKKQLLRPFNAPIISWEMIVYQLARWPWILAGVFSGLMGGILKTNFQFKVTPKGDISDRPLPFRLIIPYALLIAAYFLSTVFIQNPGKAFGYFFFVLLGIVLYAITIIVIIVMHYKEQRQAASLTR